MGIRNTLAEVELASVRSSLARGKSLGSVAVEIHHARETIKRWLDATGAPWDRTADPLPVGHPLSWDLINRGTSLEGCPCNRDLT